jgi:PST family polysaccharide transporter
MSACPVPASSAIQQQSEFVHEPRAEPAHKAEMSSYKQILNSTALVGGSQVINIGIGILRTKALAMLLGPAGFGLAGLYTSVAQVTQSIAGMGINQSGVRQIAQAVGIADNQRIARTTIVLRRTSWALGLIGAAVLLLFAGPIARVTFGDFDHAGGIVILSAVVFLNLVCAGQGALLQGTRRITDLARVSVLGALFGTIVTIPLIYVYREQGVVPSLVAVAAVTTGASWWHSRRIEIHPVRISMSDLWIEVHGLLKLGLAFMGTALLTMGSAYLMRIVIANKLGLEATGFYQAAWTLGGLYVGMILQAMGADFYPRLTTVAGNNAECNRLVCEQARVSMLLAGPGLLATLTFAPLILSCLYAPIFGEAVGVLRWICLGIAMRVISWPLGYILIVKGEQMLFFLSDLLWAAIQLSLAWFLVPRFGLEGSGMAFFGAYVFHVVFNCVVANRLSSFQWVASTRHTTVLYLATTAVVFVSCFYLTGIVLALLGLAVSLLSGLYSFRVLTKVMGHPNPRYWFRSIGA